jgi:phospholipase C
MPSRTAIIDSACLQYSTPTAVLVAVRYRRTNASGIAMAQSAANDPIQHVVVFMLENQSFDRVLGCLKAVNPDIDGVDLAHPGESDDPAGGPVYQQQAGAARTVTNDLGHDLDDVLRQMENGCRGFVADYAKKYPNASRAERQQVMNYFALGDLPVFHALAQDSLVCDRWFSSVPGPTWPNRFFVHSGTSLGHTDMPEGFDPGIHIYSQPTLYERLEDAKVPWRIYVGDFAQTWLMTAQWEYSSRYAWMSQFFADAAGDSSAFPAYSFIEPSYFGARENDEHPPHDIWLGEALLARVYNALRANAALWTSTLFVVLYDEHGGFYDHVDPATADPQGRLAVAPDDHINHFAFNKFGVRVPALLISPWLDPGVDHTVFDHTSLLKYATDKWKLGPLGLRTAAAQSFATALMARATPRTNTLEPVPVPATTIAAPSVGLNRNQNGLLAFSQFAETHLAIPPAATMVSRAQRSFIGAEALAQVIAERADDLMNRV